MSDPDPLPSPDTSGAVKPGDGVIPPQQVAIIRTGGDDGSHPITTGTVGVTPDHMPNTVYRVVSPLVAIAVRFAHLYAKSLLGFLTVGGLGLIPLGDFPHVFHASVELALAPAVVGLLSDCITIFGRLEQQFPLATGAI